MSYFIARRSTLDPSAEWKCVRNVIYTNKQEAIHAITADFSGDIHGEYRAADCDHYPDKGVWLDASKTNTQETFLFHYFIPFRGY